MKIESSRKATFMKISNLAFVAYVQLMDGLFNKNFLLTNANQWNPDFTEIMIPQIWLQMTQVLFKNLLVIRPFFFCFWSCQSMIKIRTHDPLFMSLILFPLDQGSNLHLVFIVKPTVIRRGVIKTVDSSSTYHNPAKKIKNFKMDFLQESCFC